MPVPRILVMPGSTRNKSHNARLAALAAKEFTMIDAVVNQVSLLDYPMPLYDPDHDMVSGAPANAVKLKKMMMAHHGIFIASPEYNASVSPLMKNVIDWVSRVRERNEPAYAAFRGRVLALGAASTEPHGGARGLLALRQILELGCGALVIPDQVCVGNAESAFDEMDNLKDARQAAALKALVRRLVDTAQQLN
ncbi:MAG TPA: NAD(P)H-dependent oxidoreductase [Xanthobacteraceae bacterium]|nr:NAD(P)H-dependent oxidoreductase [Xanthobacteraceae bacterium]